MRLALREEFDARATKVLVTSLDNTDLSFDILVRLTGGKLYEIKNWEIVRALFQSHTIDPRLTRHAWMADALLNCLPVDGFPAARGGFLDAETAWPVLLKSTLGLAMETPDVTALLKWSLSSDGVTQFCGLEDEFRQGVIDWLASQAGPVAEAILRCIEHMDRPDAVPLGLAAGVVFHPNAAGKLDKAAGRLEERYFGGRTPETTTIQRWNAAAAEVMRLQLIDQKLKRQQLQRADEILREVQGEEFAYLSETSLLGFDQRLARFGQRLNDVIGSSADAMTPLLEARQAVQAHDLASRESRQMKRVEMAVRLTRWLIHARAAGLAGPASLAGAAHQHLRDGGFVDWARLSLRAPDPVREVSEAYGRLFDEVTKVRELQSKQFAQLLVDWTAAGSAGDEVVPMERFLESIVAPLAAQRPVLLIVIDGMSVAVSRELLADLTRHEWTALCEDGRVFNRPAIATIPSVTEFSRTSLLCGRLAAGSSADEKVGFAAHPALRAHCRNDSPPVLFHKSSLQESIDAELARDVRDAIQSTHRQIVGVVVNAVDDHLLKGEQIDTQWSRDEIKILPLLLHEAKIAQRLVLLVSDHGHVLDCQTHGRQHAVCGERWRAATDAPVADELLVEGQRVMTEGHRLIAPWSECVRYGIKKNGYHGGLTPQEMVAPVIVLASNDEVPIGWQEQPVDIPAWWDELVEATTVTTKPAPKLRPAKPKARETLFDHLDDDEPVIAPPAVIAPAPQWVTRLFGSPVYAEQKRLAGRNVPSDDVLTKLLGSLDDRGGKMTVVATARTLELPEMRLPGLLAKVQRLLNVDGYAVLSRDDASDTIELNRELLLKQFDLT